MSVKPIHNQIAYENAVERIEQLMDAKPGTAKADELEVLATLVEKYEDQHFKITAPTPIAAIRFRMEQQDLSPRDLEPYIGSRARVAEVLNGTRPLSIDMIRSLNTHLGIPAEVLIHAEPKRVERTSSELSKPAAKQLVSLGLMKTMESVDDFIQRAFGQNMAGAAMLRKTRTERTNAKTDFVAVQAWCAGVMLCAKDIDIKVKFKPDTFDVITMRGIVALSREVDGISKVRNHLAGLGIILVILPHLQGTHLDGAALLRSDGVPIVALTLRRDRIDNFWFTLMHEIAHVKLHLRPELNAILDDLEIGSSEVIENEADQLAQDVLIPENLWATANVGTFTRQADLIELAARAKVHPAIVAGRWQLKNKDFRKFSKILGHGTVKPILLRE